MRDNDYFVYNSNTRSYSYNSRGYSYYDRRYDTSSVFELTEKDKYELEIKSLVHSIKPILKSCRTLVDSGLLDGVLPDLATDLEIAELNPYIQKELEKDDNE